MMGKEINIHSDYQVVDIDSIFLDPENAKKHSERDIEEKKASLSKYGFVKPIVVSRNSRIISAGNGVYMAATALGLRKVPVVFTDHSPIEAKGFGIADNRLSDNGEYDLEQFNLNIAEIAELDTDVDWKALGFEKQEIDLLLASMNTEITDNGSPQFENEQEEDIPLEDQMAKPIKLTNGQREVFAYAFEKLRKELGDYKVSEGKAIELICANYNA